MIWLYFFAAAWGVFLIVAAWFGGKRDDRDEITWWMVPVTLTGLLLFIVGSINTVEETVRLYG